MPEVTSAIPVSIRPPRDFEFVEPEGRPFRAVSIETEVDGKEGLLAKHLYKNRVIGTDYRMGYRENPGDVHPCVAYLNYDGTVTGGELVFDRLYLTNPLHAKALYKALIELRKLAKAGSIAYNPNCGGHIHVDATGYGFYDVLRLAINYGHVEEVIHRLAGAGATYGHRSLYKGADHRIREPGGYSAPIIKGPFVDPGTTFKLIRQQRRHSGLNFTLYMANSCRGCKGKRAIGPETFNKEAYNEEVRIYRRGYGQEPPQQYLDEWKRIYTKSPGWDMKDCTCPKKKHTVEWRVWNSQGHPRILYAWIAFMQAMHAYAWVPGNEKNYPTWDEREPFEWTGKAYKDLTDAQIKTAQERVDWIFSELPMTDEEKDALAYTFQRTPYKAWGKPFFTERLKYAYRPPPYANVYEGIPNRDIADIADAAPFEQVKPVHDDPWGDNDYVEIDWEPEPVDPMRAPEFVRMEDRPPVRDPQADQVMAYIDEMMRRRMVMRELPDREEP